LKYHNQYTKKALFLGLDQSFWRQKWASKNGESEPTSYPAENSQLYSADFGVENARLSPKSSYFLDFLFTDSMG
jgi:hypothetical protein